MWASDPTPDRFQFWPWGGFWLTPPTPPNPALRVPVKNWTCPADSRTLQVSYVAEPFNYDVAFTAYLGVSGTHGGITGSDPDHSKDGILYYMSKVKIADITDGTSNTFMVGERPPSKDLYYGWWFAGGGWDNLGTGDVVLGARDYGYAASMGCPPEKVGLQPGELRERCDQVHFWSMHPGGANFLRGDGSVRFVSYSIDSALVSLATAAGGEVNPDY